MKSTIKKVIIAGILANSLIFNSTMTLAQAFNTSKANVSNSSKADSKSSNSSNTSNTSENTKAGFLEKIVSYDSGDKNEDGGVEEILDFNKDNNYIYSVNGKKGVIDVVGTKDSESGKLVKEINVKENLEKELPNTNFKEFKYGDMTSLSISSEIKLIAVALQDEDYSKKGLIAFIDFDGNIKHIVESGVQPDMVTFSKDGKFVLAANEGEPRKGYGQVDPEGSITVIETTSLKGEAKSTIVDFKEFDEKLEALTKEGVVIKKDSKPSIDLEPEYIAIDSSSKFAYVTLQENNSIGKVNLETKKVENIMPLGFKNHNDKGNELDLKKDKKFELKNENVYGIYMPDGITTFDADGTTYLLTANEGDSREWEDYKNEVEKDDVVYLNKEDYLGLDLEKDYIFGGRSFSIFKVNNDKLELVYDSGSQMEKITGEKLPEFFNASNDKIKLDGRSGKKGPEPEGITLGKVKDKTYAFIGLERIGGIMTFDITNPKETMFVDYTNSRDFSEDIKGDVAPEGLVFVEGDTPMLYAAYEVSGTLAGFKINVK